MSLSKKDYQKLAQAIVDDRFSCGTPLRESLVKVADDHQMNVHETRRLLEATNLKAHLTLFKEASDDKYIEFDVIEPEDVVQELFGRVEPSQGDRGPGEKVAAFKAVDQTHALPDEYAAEKYKDIEKVASASVPEVETPNKNPYSGDRGFKKVAKVNKVAEELHNAILEKKLAYEDAIDDIADEFRSVYSPDFREFEKDAYALHKTAASNVVLKVCESLRIKPQETVKTASEHYVIDKPVHEKLARAVDIYGDLRDHINGYKHLRERAKALLYA